MRLDKGQIEVIDDAMADVLRKKTPAERIGIGFAIWKSSVGMLKTHLKNIHPDWSDEEIGREVAKRVSNGTL
jgi:hypothetical protein